MTDPTFEDTPYPYSLSGKWASVVRALAIVESSEDENLPMSDGGQAFGLLRQHVGFLTEWWRGGAGLSDYEINHMTWAEVQIRALTNYLDHYEVCNWTIDEMVQAYNLGVEAVTKGARNPQYLAKYKKALASFGGTEP